ncbi:(deoxy)nucleoside triphosphate pyrophosphohydrolase [Geodermatophilus sp. SYSU D00758]
MPRLRFTTLVEAPLTVAFDVARGPDGSWSPPLEEVEAVRPERVVHARGGLRRTRRFAATGAGTRVDDELEWAGRLPGALGRVADRLRVRRLGRAASARLDAYAAVAARRARDVVQVVGAALVDGDRVLVAQRSGGPYDGCWEFPGGKVEPGEDERAGLVRELEEELGLTVVPGAFLGEVVLDGVVAGGAPGGSTLRLWSATAAGGAAPTAHEHAELRWVGAADLDDLDWIPADRPLLPAVRGLLDGRR